MGGNKKRGSRPITFQGQMYLIITEKGSSSDSKGNSMQPASPNYSVDTYCDDGGDSNDMEIMLMSMSHTALAITSV